MKFKLLIWLLVLGYCAWQISLGLPGWDTIYHGAMTKWVSENGLSGWIPQYQEEYSYPPGLHILGSFFLESGLEPAFISYLIGAFLLSLIVLVLKNGCAFAASGASYNLLFAGFIPNSIGMFIFSVIFKFKKLIPLLVGSMILISPQSFVAVIVLAIFVPEIRIGIFVGILLASPWIILNLPDFGKFTDHTAVNFFELPQLLGPAIIVLFFGLIGKNKLPVWTLFLLSFNPLPGLWDRLLYFAFLISVEDFEIKWLVPVLLIGLQLAPVVVHDWPLLYWSKENLKSEALAERVLRPALLAVSGVPVTHGKGWKNEQEYDAWISCQNLTTLRAKYAIMSSPCPEFGGFRVYQDNSYHILGTIT